MPTDPTRVLVVDDDFGIRTLLEVTIDLDDRFKLMGCAATAGECLRMVDSAGPGDIDAVLVDVTLPDLDGIELVERLRGLLPNARIALFTGWTDADTKTRARAAGADEIFAKDGNTKRLLGELHALALAH